VWSLFAADLYGLRESPDLPDTQKLQDFVWNLELNADMILEASVSPKLCSD
jgi:hypothetical protein